MLDSVPLVSVLVAAVGLSVPILWAALGETIGERAGVLNIGIEGVMLIGAFTSAVANRLTGSLLLAVLAGLAGGLVSGVFLSWMFVWRGLDQVVGGIGFTLLATGITTVLYQEYLVGGASVATFEALRIPGLYHIPIIGSVLFGLTGIGYAAVLAAFVVSLVLNRTWFGLGVRSVGDGPAAVEASGLNPLRITSTAVIASCALVGIGGAALVLSVAGHFVPGITGGRGFIAIAVVMLARWKPLGTLAAALLFGGAEALQFQVQAMPAMSGLPKEIWLALPYVLAIVAIVVFKSLRFPRYFATPYLAIRGGVLRRE